MSLHAVAVRQPRKLLTQLLHWLDKAEAHAGARGFEPEVYLDARLVPDMFPLRRQIQAACDAAKFMAARGADVEAPKHPDDETTLEQLRERVRAVIAYLGEFQPSAFVGQDDRLVTLPFLPPGKAITAADYIVEIGLPNFMFHLTTCYAILRASGVELGKRDYIGGLTLQDV